jgi:glycosyltransferase involved in cell wall biosynthesis
LLISVLVPVLGRPQNAQKVVDSLDGSIRGRTDIELIFIASAGDVDQLGACLGTGRLTLIANWEPEHDYARKMNYALAYTSADWVLLGSDDITFEPGWDVEMLRVAEGGKRVIGSNDKANRLVYQKHLFSTHTLVARSYIEDPGASLDGPGSLVSEAYDHNFCDRELAGLAQFRGEWVMAPRAIIRHSHPGFGTAPQDATYEKGRKTFLDDQVIFWERSERWERHGLIEQELSLIKRSKQRIAKVEATARARAQRRGTQRP